MGVTWILEREVFSDNHDRLAVAALEAGHNVMSWDDSWWSDKTWPVLDGEYAVFHGSLGNANRIAAELPWRPAAFCDAGAFACSAWYDRVGEWLLHQAWVFATVGELVDNPDRFLSRLGDPQAFFVRPDSPLKPFSGRVLERETLSLDSLDYGYYYEDKSLSIVLTPVLDVGEEWRFVVANGRIVSGSAYEASGRIADGTAIPQEVMRYAAELAANLVEPQPLYILDVCVCSGDYKLLELNPFSGADLYGCDRRAIVDVVERMSGIPS